MTGLYRRRLLQIGAALGITGAVSSAVSADDDHDDHDDHGDHDGLPHMSPHALHMNKYEDPVPIPEEREADGTHDGAEYHNITIEETGHDFHAEFEDETTVWGFDGQFPGPILAADQNQELAVEVDNSDLPEEHLLEVDERIDGTTSENYVGYDGPVPEVRNSTHFHGLDIAMESDGQADMWISPDGVEGPRRSLDVQEVPNEQARLTSTYHDHTRGITRLNNYAGLVGPYYIRSEEEKELNLPEGDYDIPLLIADRSFTHHGELYYPDGFEDDFGGDTATVNGKVWPYLEVEPRKYRLRIINGSNARTFDLGLENNHEDMDHVPSLYQISPGHGFLEEVVEIGHHGDMHSLVMAPFERADVIVDFSDFAGQTFTVTNDADFPYVGDMDMDHDDGDHDHGDDLPTFEEEEDAVEASHQLHLDGRIHPMTMEDDDGHEHTVYAPGEDHEEYMMAWEQFFGVPEVMQIEVADEAEGEDTTADPAELELPERDIVNPNAANEIREITMGMGMDEHGLMFHDLNENRWGDPIEIKPQLGHTELWDLRNDDHHTHPIHLHLVEFKVVDRWMHDDHDDMDGMGDDDDHDDHDMDHPMGPYPNEKGGKDVVRVDPGETVRIAVKFNRKGMYPFHCHVLEHEDHDMMRPFKVVTGNPDDDDDGGDSEDEGPPGHGGSIPGHRGSISRHV